MTFVDKFLDKHKEVESVLDVGSRNVSGTIKENFVKRAIDYTGFDMVAGNNVDIEGNSHELDKYFKKGQFDVIVCFDTLEHDDKFWLSVEQMKALLDSGGYLLIGVPSRYCPKHDWPHDYWRFMEDGVKSMFDGMEEVHIEVEYASSLANNTEDEIYGWGRKP